MGCSPHRHNQDLIVFWLVALKFAKLLAQGTPMPETIKRWDHHRNIGGVFSKRGNADKAIQAFRDFGVPKQDKRELLLEFSTVSVLNIIFYVVGRETKPLVKIR